MNNFSPEEDEVIDHKFTIECVRGHCEFGSNEVALNSTELSQIE